MAPQILLLLKISLLLWATVLPCYAFLMPTQDARQGALLRNSPSADDEEPDLFDYFDPLLSPHEYPNGINPDNSPKNGDGEANGKSSSQPKRPFGLDLISSEFPAAFVPSSSSSLPTEESSSPTGAATDEDDQEPTMNRFKKQEKQDGEELDLFDVFDPTLSPHQYPNGIPSTKRSSSQTTLTVGILLMDHGSRNDASNQRLHDMARLYQNTLGDPQRIIVKAAHMEIASPSIPDVLNEFAELGVDEIVCHPFFLSPGRHVKEDIPRIVEDAIENLGLDIPVITTSPVGSHTELMINAIHSLVEESSAILSQYTSKGKVGPGGN